MHSITDTIFIRTAKEFGFSIPDEERFLVVVAAMLLAGEPYRWEAWLRESLEGSPETFGITRDEH